MVHWVKSMFKQLRIFSTSNCILPKRRAAEGGGGVNLPGPPGSVRLYNFFVGHQSFSWVKYFPAKGKIFGFLGQRTEIWYEKLR
jgi:hypothetical protein